MTKGQKRERQTRRRQTDRKKRNKTDVRLNLTIGKALQYMFLPVSCIPFIPSFARLRKEQIGDKQIERLKKE